MADKVTVRTTTGYGQRIGNAIGGILAGIIFVVVAFPLLFWNEGRSVKTYRSLKEGARIVVPVAADAVSGANEGKLVHLSGQAITPDTLRDPVFGVAANAIKLFRNVEMYQWQEQKSSKTVKKMGGSTETETTYSYSKSWSKNWIDSSQFQEKDGHQNPASMAVASEQFVSPNVAVGAFSLSGNLIGQIQGASPLPAGQGKKIPALGGKQASLAGKGYYLGKNPDQPEVGDLRVDFSAVQPKTVSVLAKQVGNSLAGYLTQAGGTIERLDEGVKSADDMFAASQKENTIITWLLRAAGCLMMYLGFALVFKPLSVLADVVPFIGSLVGMGTGLLAFSLAVPLSLLTIAVAWIAYRPVLGVLLLAAAGGVVFLAVKMKKSKPSGTAASA